MHCHVPNAAIVAPNRAGLAARALVAIRRMAGLLCVGLVLMSAACASEDPADLVVSWPELVYFDEIALQAEGLARRGDRDAVGAMLDQLLGAGRAVTADTIPSNVADRPQVETILGDLTNLVDGIAADPAAASELVLGVHPATARLMAAAGMPHVHATQGSNGGYLHPVFGTVDGAQVGTAEIMLDAGTGQMQVWLMRGGRGGDPWLLPADTTLELTLPLFGRSVTLAARDGEGGAGGTAVFSFDGAGQADTDWMRQGGFSAAAELRFADATTGAFVLKSSGGPAEGADAGERG